MARDNYSIRFTFGQQLLFLPKYFFETFFPPLYRYWLRAIIMGSLARFPPYPADFHCVAAIAMAGRTGSQQEAIFLSLLSYIIYLEHLHYVVDMECFATRRPGRFFCQQPGDEPALALVFHYKKTIREMDRLWLIDHLLAGL